MDLTFIDNLLQEHSELHVVVEEHESIAGDSHIGLRDSNTEIISVDNVIVVDDGRKEHYIDGDSVIYAEPAIEFPD